MKLDIQTLAIISCLIFITQFIALFVQYGVNKSNREIIWWLTGSTLSALGVLFMPLVMIKSLRILAMLANPLFVLGQIFFYVGLIRFLGKKENKWIQISIYVVFVVFYYFFIFVKNGISERTFVGTAVVALISFMCAARLFSNRDRHISGSAIFTAIVFMAYGCFYLARFFAVIISPPVQAYSDLGILLELSFMVPILASLLWTFGFIIMMNQRLNAENREEKEKLLMIFNTSPDAAIISRLADGVFVDVNDGFLAMSGYTRAELIENSTTSMNIWQRLADRKWFVTELENKRKCENMEFVFRRKDGSLLTGRISANIITIKTIPHIISVVHDITKIKQAEIALRESEELYRSILNASPDDITITDLNGRVLVFSPAAIRMLGYHPEMDHVIGSPVTDYILPEEREKARSNILSMSRGEYTGPNEYHAVRKDHSIFDIEVNSGLILGADGNPEKMVFIIRDISERKQAEQQIQLLVRQLEAEKKTAQFNANTDSLTMLANRRYFDEALSTEFQRLKCSGSLLALIMLDVDHFKKFNDRYGHLAGDDCLRQIGTSLKTFIRPATDIVARYGGEEFVVILTDTDQSEAAVLAERIRKAVEALAIPHSNSDIAEYVTISLGVVTVSPSLFESTDQVVALADEALYRAKKSGRNRISVITENAVLERTIESM